MKKHTENQGERESERELKFLEYRSSKEGLEISTLSKTKMIVGAVDYLPDDLD